MSTNLETSGGIPRLRNSTPIMVLCAALVSFAAGSLFTASLHGPKPVFASNNRVFELMIYHTLPGKASALESVFRNSYQLKAKYGIDVVGYWVPNDDPAWNDTFIYLVAHPNRAEADAHWKAYHADPAFPAQRKAAAALIQQEKNGDYKVDEIYMRPSDFSQMK